MLVTKDGYKLVLYKTPDGEYKLGCSKYLVGSNVLPSAAQRLETKWFSKELLLADGLFFSVTESRRNGFVLNKKASVLYVEGMELTPDTHYINEEGKEMGCALQVMDEQDKIITIMHNELDYTDLPGLYSYKGKYVMKTSDLHRVLTISKNKNEMLWWSPEVPSYNTSIGYGSTTTSRQLQTIAKLEYTLLSAMNGFKMNKAVQNLIEQNTPMFNKYESVVVVGDSAIINYGYTETEIIERQTVRRSREVYVGSGSGYSGGDGYSKGYREFNQNSGRNMKTEYYDTEEDVVVGRQRQYPDGTVVPDGQWRLAF
jgi:hypothetical protein